MTAGGELTAGQVGERLGVKSGMVRRYALALEAITGISLEVDPVRGRLYPLAVVELLERARAHLLAHPGESVEGALRAVTGQGEGGVTAPVPRLPGMLTREELGEVLREALAPALAPVLEELTSTRTELEQLHRMVEALPSRLTADLMTSLPGELAHQVQPVLEQSITRALEQHASTVNPPRTVQTHHVQPTAGDEPTADLAREVAGLRAQLARLEVTTHAALAKAPADPPAARPAGLLGLLARLLGR